MDRSTDSQLLFDGDKLIKVFGPQWRLLLIGAGELTRRVAQLGLALDFEVTICDSRPEYAEGWCILPGNTPAIRKSTAQAMVDALRCGAQLAMPSYQTHRGHPVGFSKLFRNQLESLNGDIDARTRTAHQLCRNNRATLHGKEIIPTFQSIYQITHTEF